MSALLGEVGGFLDRYIIGFALGAAAGPALAPYAQSLANEAWTLNPVVPPPVLTLALGIAQGQIPKGQAYQWAKEQGFDKGQMDALVNAANVGPPLASALTLLRRGVWKSDQYVTALNREGIEPEWYPGLLTLQDVWLTASELAVMVQRGIVPNAQIPGTSENLLPAGPPTEVGKVPPMPQVPIDTLTEAGGNGVTPERLAALARIIGLPASPDLAARMVFRGIIERVDFDRAISEGNTRNEWAPFLFEGFRQILTAHDYVELRLRGWIDTDAEMYAGTALHGMSPEDTDRLHKVLGRPLVHNQVFVGLLRGGVYDGPTTEIDPAYLKSLRESNMRPEWYNLSWAQRYHYPPFFQTINALNKGWIDAETATHWLTIQGYDPEAVGTIVGSVAAAKGAPDSFARSATTSLLRRLRSGYVSGRLTETQVQTALGKTRLSVAEQADVLAVWAEEKAVAAQEAANVAAATPTTPTA